MWGIKMIEYIWALIFLLICSISDLRERKVNVGVCIISGLVGIGVNFIRKVHSVAELLFGAVIGMTFIGISIITRQRIGLGDSFVILALGLILGGIQSFNIILWAFILCTLLAFLEMIILRVKMNDSLPFVPFVTVASIIQFFCSK